MTSGQAADRDNQCDSPRIKRATLIRTRSAKIIRARSILRCITRGRTHERTRPDVKSLQKVLANEGPSTHESRFASGANHFMGPDPNGTLRWEFSMWNGSLSLTRPEPSSEDGSDSTTILVRARPSACARHSPKQQNKAAYTNRGGQKRLRLNASSVLQFCCGFHKTST